MATSRLSKGFARALHLTPSSWAPETVNREMKHFRSAITPAAQKMPGRYGGRHTVTALAGDGIGPEMMEHVKGIFALAHVPVDFEELNLNSSNIKQGENDLQEAITSIQRNGVALKGNVETKFDDPAFKSRNMELRKQLDLRANVLHCSTVPTVPSRHTGINIIMIRENTEGEYSGQEHTCVPGVVESLKIVTRERIEWISHFAFDYALRHGRKKITAVHKANIQKLGDGLFLKVVNDVSKLYPQIKCDSMIVDNASMQLVAKPQQFDIMLMPNLYGNIISNIACGLVGGPGLVSGVNIGNDYAVFETGTRNTGSSLIGKDIANPTSFLRASVDMLKYLGLSEHADMISDAIFRTLTERMVHTPDIGGKHKTSDMIRSVRDYLQEEMDLRK
ncbi:unnamed protein product, partial [Mesorhabditis belari]|uniref:Isocitrate dehydrogenase [NAD] subunit, mitochondrial n=1 Tax=Mesorhabditis belari TaxID=2138241 RepID=A0AAF3FEH7_9BILA